MAPYLQYCQPQCKSYFLKKYLILSQDGGGGAGEGREGQVEMRNGPQQRELDTGEGTDTETFYS